MKPRALQLKQYIIRPVLKRLEMWSVAAEDFLLGIAATESALLYLDQFDRASRPGPAYGLWQMEEWVAQDQYDSFLKYRPELLAKVTAMRTPSLPMWMELQGNLFFACAMARVKVRRIPEPIPMTRKEGARQWKQHWNTALGAGEESDFFDAWNKHVEGPI